MLRASALQVTAAALLGAPLLGCASGGRVKVDLDPARSAVAEARAAGAPARSPDSFHRAEEDLQRAEALLIGQGMKRDHRGAQRAADLAVAEAHCATALARSLEQTEKTTSRAAAQVAASTAETDRLNARLKKAEDDQHRLEDKVAALTRDLEVTETELIRTKARLKGNETKAEASAAIAEARILAGRLSDDKSRASVLARSEESLAKAEEQISQGNYGAALFFATKAQDLVARASDTEEAHPSAGDHAPPAPPSYVVRTVARLRGGPSLSDPVVGHVPAGVRLEAEGASGAWVKVTYRGLAGWIHSSLLQ